MGLCASSDAKTKNRGRNTNRRGKHDKKGGRNGKNTRNQQRKKYDSESENTSEGDDDSRSDSDSDHNTSKPTQQQPLKITTVASDSNNYPPIPQEDMDILFYKAFTCTSWSNAPVPHELLRNAMKLALLAPSAYNCCPMRVVFVTSADAKAKLFACVEDALRTEVANAPVTAIVCTDKLYTRNLPKLMPYVPNAQQMFEQYDDLNEMIRIRNSNLQAGYLILALRSLGLAVGPICALNNEACDDTFLENTSWKSNIIINLGYPKDQLYPSLAPPLPFDVAAKLIV